MTTRQLQDRKVTGAGISDGQTGFRLWAPLKKEAQVHVVHPFDRLIPMLKDEEGYWFTSLEGRHPGLRYFFRVDGSQDLPDPASQAQPEGVHGPSEVIDHLSFRWTDNTWQPPPFTDLIFYELHVGTFTREGTFEAIIPRLDDLVSLGINAIELMPVSQFPGTRNWGYDGVFPYAVQHSYGGANGLKKLVNACHERGVCVFLDVVYNHIGPEGNYLPEFAPYFTPNYSTPWGDALNFDGEWSDGVRDYFAGNAVYWFEYFHVDGLRCDAIHTIYDNGAIHFLEYLHQHVKQLEQQTGRSHYLVAESDLNSPKVVKSPGEGGFGFDAQWLDDFHHALYTILDKNGKERYFDFGSLDQLAKAYTDGFVLSGEWVKFRKRKYGRSSAGVAGNHFVVFNQNHDQVGNRVRGERLSVLVDHERLKIAAAAVLLAPYIPMLFMGEEYGEQVPFFYFVSHSDPELIEAVRNGRQEEFGELGDAGELTDAQDEQTFLRSRLNWDLRDTGKYKDLLNWHRQLIRIRKTYSVFRDYDKSSVRAEVIENRVLVLHRRNSEGRAVILFNFSDDVAEVDIDLPSEMEIILSSAPHQPHAQQGMYRNGSLIHLAPASVAVLYGYTT